MRAPVQRHRHLFAIGGGRTVPERMTSTGRKLRLIVVRETRKPPMRVEAWTPKGAA